jgi:HlyD family secretion protein
MKKYSIVILIILVVLGGLGFWYFRYKKTEEKIFIITEKPQYGYISKSVTATGTIEPVDTVTVGTQVSGTISNIYTDFNARVTKGQLIAELDKSLFLAQVNQYKANLDVANATSSYAKSNFDRQTLLFKTGAISKADFETAQDQNLTAKATVASVQAQLDAAQKNLSYSSIYSPVNGVVLLRNISIGQTVAASFSTPTLFVIAKDISKMQVRAAVDEADIGEVKDSQRVIFTVDAYPDISFSGKVAQIRLEPVISSNVVTYTTIITAPNEDLKLKPGMTANIFIYTSEVNNALLISSKDLKFKPDAAMEKQYTLVPIPAPTKAEQDAKAARDSLASHKKDSGSTAMQTGDSKKTSARVWVQQGDTLVEKRIKTGLNDDTHVEVQSGLTVDDLVITAVNEAGKKSLTTSSAPAKSPFMPTRQPSRPAGGAARKQQP